MEQYESIAARLVKLAAEKIISGDYSEIRDLTMKAISLLSEPDRDRTVLNYLISYIENSKENSK